MDIDFYRYGFHSGPDTMTVLSVLAFVAAVVCTVLLMVLVTPEKRRAKLNKFFRAVADICNFKGFLVEYIVRALYIFLTLFYILVGFFTLFVDPLTGLLAMVLGPIVLRVVFELTMMFIVLVKNVIQINKKLPGQADDAVKPDAPAGTGPAPATETVFCTQCGTPYDPSKGGCPNGCKE